MKIASNIPGPLLSKLRRQFRLNFFVETGTCHGDTTELAAIYFDHVWSCEIDASLSDESEKRLAVYPNVHLYRMPSPQFIQRIRPQVSQPALWWLDAHWCGGPVKPPKECPLLEELAEIGGTSGHSVIMIDDANLIVKPPPPPHDPDDWPTMPEVMEIVNSWNENNKTEYIQGENSSVFLITPEQSNAV